MLGCAALRYVTLLDHPCPTFLIVPHNNSDNAMLFKEKKDQGAAAALNAVQWLIKINYYLWYFTNKIFAHFTLENLAKPTTTTTTMRLLLMAMMMTTMTMMASKPLACSLLLPARSTRNGKNM